MTRWIAVLCVVALVALSGCSGLLGDESTPTPEQTTTAPPTTETTTTDPTTTDQTTTKQTTISSENFPAGVAENGTLTDPETLVRSHTRQLSSSGYETSAGVEIEPQSDGPARLIQYQARISEGNTPFWIRINTSTRDQIVSQQIIWGNETDRYRRIRQATRSGNISTDYDRQSQGAPSIDPSIRGFEEVLTLGKFEVAEVTGSGDDRQIRLVAETVRPEVVNEAPVEVSQYRGEMVVDDSDRIRRATIQMEYTDSRGTELVASVEYSLDREGAVDIQVPGWIQTANKQTLDVTIEAQANDDNYLEITNTGSDPVPPEFQLAIATEAGPTLLNIESPIGPGEKRYIYAPAGGDLRLGQERPTGELQELASAYRLVIQNRNGTRIANIVVETE